jgi:hypothetical protein
MCVGVFVYTWMWVYVWVYVCLHVSEGVCGHGCVYVGACVFMCFVCVHEWCVCVCAGVWLCLCLCVCM